MDRDINRIGNRVSIKIVVAFILFTAQLPVQLQAGDDTQSSFFSPVYDYFANWFVRVTATQAEQPHWASPVSLTSPLLLQLVRYDVLSESLKGGRQLNIFGGGKGVEFIPSEHVQFIVGLPPWESENTTPRKDGWGDESFLMKYRFAAANEQEGNYVVTGFLGLTVPTGSDVFTSHHFVFAPTLAGGKGWGDFDIQGSIGTSIPDDGTSRGGQGTPLVMNAVFQYRVEKMFWPEVELNYTYWPNGSHEGLNQLFVTPGLVVGKFPIWQRLTFASAVGCQVAVTDNPLMHNNLIFSGRLYF
jgi:hypothetical protein